MVHHTEVFIIIINVNNCILSHRLPVIETANHIFTLRPLAMRPTYTVAMVPTPKTKRIFYLI